jgi:hypothetical protein
LTLLRELLVDDAHFDALTRSLRSRRAAVTGLLGGLAAMLGLGDDANAHNPAPACRRLTDPARRRRCQRRARAHHRNRHVCKPRPVAVTCRNRCGGTRNNCRHKVSCTCPAGKLCLPNQSCSQACTPASPVCPAGCYCFSTQLVETSQHQCVPQGISDCAQIPQRCTSSAECPFGQFCGTTACSPSGDDEERCIPVCPV